MSTFTITRRMNSVNETLFKELDKLYTSHDFMDLIDSLELAEDSIYRSRRPSVLNALYDILDKFEIKYEKNQSSQYYRRLIEKMNTDDYHEIEERLMNVINNKFTYFPQPGDFMKRLVKSLGDPDDGWTQCSIRLQILKRFIKYGNYLEEVGYGGGNAIRQYVREKDGLARAPQDAAYVANSLDEGIFGILNKCDEDCAPHKAITEPIQAEINGLSSRIKIAKENIESRENNIASMKKEIEKKNAENQKIEEIIQALTNKLEELEEKKIAAEEDLDAAEPNERNLYRGRLDRIRSEIDRIEEKNTDNKIEIDGNKSKISEKEGEINGLRERIARFNSEIADLENQIAQKNAEKADSQREIDRIKRSYDEKYKWNGTYGLIKLADDLANGYFREGGSTKKALYYFAMVYNMTFSINPPEESEDEITTGFRPDIEKDLFGDYYTNNLTRYYLNAYKQNAAAYEREPNDQGINYKNYMEIVLLYYISKSDMSPQDKLEKSAAMLEKIKARTPQAPETPPEKSTEVYREITIKEVLEKNEDELVDFMCQNYDYDIRLRNADGEIIEKIGKDCSIQYVNVSPMAMGASQNTAFKSYDTLRENYYNKIKEKTGKDNIDPPSYGLWLDIDLYERKKTQLAAGDSEELLRADNLICVLRGFNKFVKEYAFSVDKAENMSRTALVTAFYYNYNILHEDDEEFGQFGERKRKPFTEFFDKYKEKINNILEGSFYQPFSGKNIFDILLAFSSYSYLYY